MLVYSKDYDSSADYRILSTLLKPIHKVLGSTIVNEASEMSEKYLLLFVEKQRWPL